ncbi:NADPH:quinone reductase [Microbacterium sp. YY-01]|uniref:NADPH:quinone reductase n=1 Tax=Microbacterium sp. YY-01 TaxID=3421634 RepID=UPI003D18598B
MLAVPDSMKAAFVRQRGSADAIVVGEVAVPQPGEGELLVRVSATAVNHVDTFVRSGAYRTPMTFPFTIGRDLVGEVVALGAGLEGAGWRIGDRVFCHSMGHAGRQGAAAQYVSVAAERVYHAPRDCDDVQLVAALHPVATAYLALHEHGRMADGANVFIGGAAGNVGRAAVALAVASDAHVIATASGNDHARCRAWGANTLWDYRESISADRVYEVAPHGVDVWLDTSDHLQLDMAVEALALRGRIVLMSGMGAHPPLPAGALYTKDASVCGFAISNASVAELARSARAITQLVDTSAWPMFDVVQLPLAQAAQAHRMLENGEARGIRVVLRPSDDGDAAAHG